MQSIGKGFNSLIMMITNKVRLFICLNLIFLFFSISLYAQEYQDAPGFGHAHNDYEKCGRRDFIDAMKNGCNSIEIDVFPKGNKLKIAHIPLFLGFRKDLESRYLKNLDLLYKDQKQCFEEDSLRLILMIDVKRNAPKAYTLIRALAKKYEHLLAVWDNQGQLIKNGPIELLISGAKPYQELLKDSIRYMRIDGDFSKIGDEIYDANLAPRVSTNYHSFFKWKGRAEMPKAEEEKLRKLIEKAHADGRQVRFWAMPNKLVVWQKMRELGVDWLNVDRIKKFKKAIDDGLLK